MYQRYVLLAVLLAAALEPAPRPPSGLPFDPDYLYTLEGKLKILDEDLAGPVPTAEPESRILLVLGETYGYDVKLHGPMVPAGECDDPGPYQPGEGFYARHAYGNVTMWEDDGPPGPGVGAAQSIGTLSFTHFTRGCNESSDIATGDVWEFLDGHGPYFTVPQGVKPGVRYLRYSTQSYIYSALMDGGLQHTDEATTVRYVHGDIVDLGVKAFDLHNESDVCAGGEATYSFSLINWGEIESTQQRVQLWAAQNKQFTEGVRLVDEYLQDVWIPAGRFNTLVQQPRTTTLPADLEGVNYFRVVVEDTTFPALLAAPLDSPGPGPNPDPEPIPGFDPSPSPGYPHFADNASKLDKVSITVDFDWLGAGMSWTYPEGTVPKIFPGQKYRFKLHYKNKGRVSIPAGSTVTIEMKKKGEGWDEIDSFFLEDIQCKEVSLPSDEDAPEFEFTLPVDDPDAENYHPYIEVGKKRAIRLLFSAPPLIDELKTQNNKSKAKKLRIVPVPEYAIVLGRGGFEPRGRLWGSAPGTRGSELQVVAQSLVDGPERKLKFVLERSHEPGICMNFGAPVPGVPESEDEYYAADLAFGCGEAFGPGPDGGDCDNTLFADPEDEPLTALEPGTQAHAVYSGVLQSAQAMMTLSEKHSASAQIVCYDYGPVGRARVVAVDENDEEIGTPSPWLSIPADELADGSSPGDGIWDGYTEHNQENGSKFDHEIESYEGGRSGDGLSAFEEYRGFMVPDRLSGITEHQRTDAEYTRDIFVAFADDFSKGYGVGRFEPSTFGVHLVEPAQMNGWEDGLEIHDRVHAGVPPRRINFNKCQHAPHVNETSPGFQQAGLILRLSQGLIAHSDPAWPSYPASHWWGLEDDSGTTNGPPALAGIVEVYPANVEDDLTNPPPDVTSPGSSQVIPDFAAAQHVLSAQIATTIAHELGHAIGMYHHYDHESLLGPDIDNPVDDDEQLDPSYYLSVSNFDYGFKGRGITLPDGSMTPYPLNDIIKLEDGLGALWCPMRYTYYDYYFAISGDSDQDGTPNNADLPCGIGGVPPDCDFSHSVMLVTPPGKFTFCSGVTLPSDPLIKGITNHNCADQVRIKDHVLP